MSAIYGDPLLESFSRYPATSLGIAIELRPSIAPRLNASSYISVHSARSKTGQVALWRPVRHHLYRGRLISSPIESSRSHVLQERVLQEISQLIGSALFRFDESGELIDLTPGIQRESMWTLDRCDTSQFENEIRAQLELADENTVKGRIKSIFNKMHVDNRVRVAAIAVQFGVVVPNEYSPRSNE